MGPKLEKRTKQLCRRGRKKGKKMCCCSAGIGSTMKFIAATLTGPPY